MFPLLLQTIISNNKCAHFHLYRSLLASKHLMPLAERKKIKHLSKYWGVVNTGRPLQVKYWGVATPATPAALTPMFSSTDLWRLVCLGVVERSAVKPTDNDGWRQAESVQQDGVSGYLSGRGAHYQWMSRRSSARLHVCFIRATSKRNLRQDSDQYSGGAVHEWVQQTHWPPLG